MRSFLFLVGLCLLATGCSSNNDAKQNTPAPFKASVVSASPDGVPEAILFETKYGNVTYTHKLHYERLNGKCDTCHPSIFPQALAPLNYAKANHRAAEAAYSSCSHCHAVGATSFAADSNCTKCHVKDRRKS